jgi:hypothetical protein
VPVRRVSCRRASSFAPEIIASSAREPTNEKRQGSVQLWQTHRGIADVAAAGQQDAMTYAGVALRGDDRDETAQRVSNHSIFFRSEVLGGTD